MNARRRTRIDGLPSRVYQKHNAWFWVRKKDGKWIRLCGIADGLSTMHERLAAAMKKNEPLTGNGDFPIHAQVYMDKAGMQKSDSFRGEWLRQGEVLCKAFRDWDVAQIDSASIEDFLEMKWPNKLPSRRIFRSWMSSFFTWAIRQRLCSGNPCSHIKLAKAPARDVYIPDNHFMAIRAELDASMQCFVDLCYLTTMRSTEIRNLKWSQIDRSTNLIRFQPSKTLKSSAGRVDWPLTKAIDSVLQIAAAINPDSDYVIHDDLGAARGTKDVRDDWMKARSKAGLKNNHYTVKDIRAKALTDADRKGYSLQELSVAAVHTATQTTAIYLKGKKVPVSNIVLDMPEILDNQ